MSITDSPVTQLAEVAVNSASTNSRELPVDEIGSVNIKAPNRINSANARTEYCVGESSGFGSRITESTF
jgi:hypothetical protein